MPPREQPHNLFPVVQLGQKSYSSALGDQQQPSDDKIMMMEGATSVDTFQAVANSEWLMFGALLDKIFFLIYVVAFIIKLIRYSAVV